MQCMTCKKTQSLVTLKWHTCPARQTVTHLEMFKCLWSIQPRVPWIVLWVSWECPKFLMTLSGPVQKRKKTWPLSRPVWPCLTRPRPIVPGPGVHRLCSATPQGKSSRILWLTRWASHHIPPSDYNKALSVMYNIIYIIIYMLVYCI